MNVAVFEPEMYETLPETALPPASATVNVDDVSVVGTAARRNVTEADDDVETPVAPDDGLVDDTAKGSVVLTDAVDEVVAAVVRRRREGSGGGAEDAVRPRAGCNAPDVTGEAKTPPVIPKNAFALTEKTYVTPGWS